MSCARFSGVSRETTMPTAKAENIDTMQGFLRWMIGAALWNTSTQTVGESTIMPMERKAPVMIEATAPPVVNFFQVIDMSSAGKLALAAMEKASPTMQATFWPLKEMPRITAKKPKMTV